MTWLVRFYPDRWRRRYEAEFLAFLEEEGQLSLAQRLDLLLGLMDAHMSAWRDRVRDTGATRQAMVRQAAGIGVLFTTSENGGLLMRRYSLTAFFLLLGIGLGLLIPYARQTVAADLSAPPPGYTGLIYQNVDIAPWRSPDGETAVTIVNTGRAMPRLVIAMPAKQLLGIANPERDHKVILVHEFLHLGHGMVGYSLCPLAHDQTATMYLWWYRAREVHKHQIELNFAFYGRVPTLVKIGRAPHVIWDDPRAAIRDIRSLRS